MSQQNQLKRRRDEKIVKSNILAPLRSPLLDFSKANLVRTRSNEIRAPDAAKPARKDCVMLTMLGITNKFN